MKIKIYLSVLLLLTVTVGSFAQTWQWAAIEGCTNFNVYPRLVPDNKGGIFMSGSYGSAFTLQGNSMPFSSFCAFFITKLDAGGSIVWVKPYGGKGHCVNLAADKDGNLYMSGDFNGLSFTLDNVVLNFDASHGSTFIAKFNNQGTLLWAKNDFTNAEIHDINVDGSGNVNFSGFYYNGPFIFAGISHPLDMSANSSSYDGFVARYSTNGEPLWARVLSGPVSEQVTAVASDDNNNVYIGGIFNSNHPGFSDTTLDLDKTDTAVNSNDIFAAKYNSSGKLQWVRSAGGNATASESSPSICVDGPGNITLASDFRLDSITFDHAITIYGKNWCTETLLVQYDPNGTVKWARSSDGNLRIQSNSLTTRNGNVYLFGEFSGTINSITPPLNTAGMFDMYLAELDATGQWKWGVGIGSNGNDLAERITADNNGNLYLAGTTQSASITLNGHTYSGPMGSQNGDLFYGKLTLPVGIEESVDKNGFDIYPNPMSSSSLVFFSSHLSNAEVKILDILGHEKRKEVFSGQIMRIEKGDLAPGVYLLQVTDGTDSWVKKIVVE